LTVLLRITIAEWNIYRDVHTNELEIEREGSCLGATGGTGRLIVRDAPAQGRSVVVLVRSSARALDRPGRSIAVPPDPQALRTELADRDHLIWFEKAAAIKQHDDPQ
jgi:putative NADH-flavin reductase